MSQQIQEFLTSHNFFSYKDHSGYIKELDEQIHNSLSKHNQTQIHFAKKWISVKKIAPQENFIAMDLGGMNLRLSLCQPKNGKIEIIKESKAEFYEDKTYTPTILFADLKKHLDKFFTKDIDIPKTLVFSFANALKPHFRSKNRLDGEILFWGKNHKEKGLVGTSIGKELESYLNKKGYPDLEIHVINDSCAALLSANSIQKLPTSTVISIIAGTGTNICVGYKLKGCFKLTNLEFGNFDFIPYSTFDNELNHQSSTPNKFRTEKLFAGAWQNRLFNLIMHRAIKEGVIEETTALKNFEKMSSKDMENLFIHKQPNKENKAFQTIWTALTERGAYICAITISRVIKYLADNHETDTGITLLETGAILDHSEKFRQQFESDLIALLKENSKLKSIKLEIILTKDPQINGSATLLKFYK